MSIALTFRTTLNCTSPVSCAVARYPGFTARLEDDLAPARHRQGRMRGELLQHLQFGILRVERRPEPDEFS